MEINLEDIRVRYNNGETLDNIVKDYNCSQSTLRRALKKMGFVFKPRGGIQKSAKEKILCEQGYHFEAVSKDGKFRTVDYNNSAGLLKKYLVNELNINVPTLYERRKYEKINGHNWFNQYFEVIKIKNKEVKTKKCPYCDWETIDIDNKSGAYVQHLLKEHSIIIEEHLEKYPEDKFFFKKYLQNKERNEFYEDAKNYIICPICGQKMAMMVNTHLKKHGLTFAEYKEKYCNVPSVSKTTHDKLIECVKKGNSVESKKRFSSKYEREIQDFLIQNNIQFSHDRHILNGREIDILIPSLRIGIEFDGLLWHSEYFGKKSHTYHLDKTKICNENGYYLIHIFEDEYVYKKEIVYDKLRHILHIPSDKPKIMGRKCHIKEIYKYEAETFLNTYHIQGFSPSTLYLGCYYQDELVGVMSFRKGNMKNPNWELNRFATNSKYICQGIGGKMFKYFVKKYDPLEVISYADRRWTLDKDNNLYIKLGFNLENILKPDYKYYDIKNRKYIRIHKFNCRKEILHKRYGFPLTMTEKEMTKELGYDRIWDCGLFKYVWKKEKVD